MLDQAAPLTGASHADATGYTVSGTALSVALKDGRTVALADPAQFIGYLGDAAAPAAILLRHHGIHLEIQFDRTSTIGQGDAAGISDVLMESALSTILDLEDSIAAVDAEDKLLAYRNWLGILRGSLTEEVSKGGRPLSAD